MRTVSKLSIALTLSAVMSVVSLASDSASESIQSVSQTVRAITSPEEQYKRLVELTKTRKPDAAFPELLPQFKENILAIEEVLQGEHLNLFHKICREAEDFFGPTGEKLTLPSYNIVHLYIATVLGDYQRFTRQLSSGYITRSERILPSLRESLNGALEKNIPTASLFARFDSQRILPAMYVDYGLYPYTIVSKDGNLAIKELMGSLAHNMRLCALPLMISQFDGGLEQTSDAFLAHDWGHASPFFNGLRQINQAGIELYQKITSLVESMEDEKIRNLDYFCLFFMEHERYHFSRGKVVDFSKGCDEIRDYLINDHLGDLLNNCSFAVDGLTTLDVFKNYMPNKDSPFILENSLETFHHDLRSKIFNSNFLANYNLLFDIKDLLKASDIELSIWDGEALNVEGIKTILRNIFDGFKERYKDKI